MKEKPGLLLSLLVIVLSALPAYGSVIPLLWPASAANTEEPAGPAAVQDLSIVQPVSTDEERTVKRSRPEYDPSSAWLERQMAEARTRARLSALAGHGTSPQQPGQANEHLWPHPATAAAVEHDPRLAPGETRTAAVPSFNAAPRSAAEPAAIVLPAGGLYPAALREVPIAPRIDSAATITYLAGHEIRSGSQTSPYLALTIDCEQNPQRTREMLEILRTEGVQATFFVSGYYVYLFPDVVAEIAADGHELGNHSFSHPNFATVDPVTATLEILYTEAAVDRALGRHVTMRYIRFPYGVRDETIRLHAAALGYRSAFWDMDPQGWAAKTGAADVISYVRQSAHPGGVVIMHCGSASDVAALPDVLDVIREQGLIPGTLSEAIAPWSRLLTTSPELLWP